MTLHYADLSSASDLLKQMFHAAWPIRSTSQVWAVTCHQYWISALVSQTTFRGENKSGVAKCQLFSQANSDVFEKEYATGRCVWNSGYPWYRYVWEILVSQNLAELSPTAEEKSIKKKHRLARTWTQNTITINKPTRDFTALKRSTQGTTLFWQYIY